MSNTTNPIEYLYLSSSIEHPIVMNRLDSAEPINYAVAVTMDVNAGASTLDARDEQVVGTIEACHFMLSAAMNNGVESFEVMDSVSVDAAALHCTIFEEGDLCSPFSEEFAADVGDDVSGFDVLYIESDAVLDNTWGPEAISILMDNYDTCGVIAIAVSGLIAPRNSEEMTTAFVRSAKLQEMGFKRVGRTPFFCFNTAYSRPALPGYLSLHATFQAESETATA